MNLFKKLGIHHSALSIVTTVAFTLLTVFTRGAFATEPAAAVNAPNGLPWLQTLSNDFTSANAQTDLNHWTANWGTGAQDGLTGWGNNEWEYYNDATTSGNLSNSNLYVNGSGLNITAIVNGSNITSARINTKNNFSQTYGLFQWTASIPSGGGLWPALWMLPKPNSYGGWPTSGEVDVFESGGSGLTANKQEQGSYHTGPSYDISQTAVYGPSGYDTRNSNTYDLLWLPVSTTNPHGLLQWYVNGTLYETRTGSNPGTNNTGWYNPSNGTTNAGPFDKSFYLVMNMAIGGSYTNNQIPANGSYTMTISDVEAFSLPILGDVNRDGHLDSRDVTAMESALADPTDFSAAEGITTAQLSLIGDINGDGSFNNADLQKLLTVLKTGGGSDTSVPEPSTFLLFALGALTVWWRKIAGGSVSSKTPAF
jgi:beta-glucanase (GH16 family)